MKRFLAVLVLAIASLFTVNVYGQATAKPDIIEVIEINGEIGAHTATFVAQAVEKVNETPKIKGVLLIVNSPGGGASSSAVIYQELAKIKVPVVGYCEYVCASGGVYALMAPSVKFIGVRDEAIGGSVGVLMQLSRYNRLLEWAKIDSQTFKSGALKDAGNPTRAGNDEDTKYLQSIVDTLAQNFYQIVAKARPQTRGHWEEIKTAKIFIGEGIVKVGLADAVMSRDDALKKVKDLSGSKNSFTRDELRKMTKDTTEAASLKHDGAGDSISMVDRLMSHLDYSVGLLKEVHSGESVTFQYRMPYRF